MMDSFYNGQVKTEVIKRFACLRCVLIEACLQQSEPCWLPACWCYLLTLLLFHLWEPASAVKMALCWETLLINDCLYNKISEFTFSSEHVCLKQRSYSRAEPSCQSSCLSFLMKLNTSGKELRDTNLWDWWLGLHLQLQLKPSASPTEGKKAGSASPLNILWAAILSCSCAHISTMVVYCSLVHKTLLLAKVTLPKVWLLSWSWTTPVWLGLLVCSTSGGGGGQTERRRGREREGLLSYKPQTTEYCLV